MPQNPEELFYESHIFMCVNKRENSDKPCCFNGGAEGLAKFAKKYTKELGLKKVRVNGSMCLNRCDLGPVMVIYPEGVWYGYKNEQDIQEIIDTHLVKKKLCQKLILKNEN